MHTPMPSQSPNSNVPVVLVHAPGALRLSDRVMLDDVFGVHQQWQPDAPLASAQQMQLIRGMVDLDALLPNLSHYRLGVLVSHPVTYIHDLYQAARASTSHPHHALASDLSLSDFATNEVIIKQTTNPFITLLAGSQANTSHAVDAAVEHLQRAEYVATTAPARDAMLMMAYWLDAVDAWQQAQSQPETPSPWQLTDEQAEEVLKRNDLDLALYNAAQKLSQHKLSDMAHQSVIKASQHQRELTTLKQQIERQKNEIAHQAKANARRAQLIRDFIRKV